MMSTKSGAAKIGINGGAAVLVWPSCVISVVPPLVESMDYCSGLHTLHLVLNIDTEADATLFFLTRLTNSLALYSITHPP